MTGSFLIDSHRNSGDSLLLGDNRTPVAAGSENACPFGQAFLNLCYGCSPLCICVIIGQSLSMLSPCTSQTIRPPRPLALM